MYYLLQYYPQAPQPTGEKDKLIPQETGDLAGKVVAEKR